MRVSVRRLSLTTLLACEVLGCSNDPNRLFDRGSDASDAGSDAGTRAEPTAYDDATAIYGDDAQCVDCVRGQCEAPARACADAPACATDAACRARCDGDPWCELRCRDAQSRTERPTYPLEDCIVEQCFDPCDVGTNFECVGSYAEPAPDLDEPLVRTLHITQNLLAPMRGPEGLRVRLCAAGQAGGDLECSNPAFEAFTDASSQVRIEYPEPETTSGITRAFDAFLEITDPAHDPPRVVPALAVPPPPQGSNVAPDAFPVQTADEAMTFAELGGNPIVDLSTYAGVVILLYDCRVSDRMRAVGATFAVPTSPEVKLNYAFDPAAEATTSDRFTSGTAGGPVPPGFAVITASYEGELVARKVGVPIRAGAGTGVYLVPH